ncbi:hypothetical protein U9M48_038631, partial [Paspalum notatum var. saurae]
MGTFLGHFLPGLAFAILGVWHTLNTVKGYKLKGASGFRSATWFPFPSPLPGLRHLELYLLLSFSVLSIADQLIDLPILALCLQPDSLEHATMYLHLAVYASVALAADLASRRDDAGVGDVVAALAASVFGQELFLLRFHSVDHAGLEGHYHWLLQLVVVASLAATATSAVLPRSFGVAVVRSASVLLQGVWFMAMGLALWVPALVPSGCHGVAAGSAAMRSAVACATEEAARRAVAIANLQFSWAIAAVWVVTAYLCLRVDCRSLEYMQLQTPPTGVVAGDMEAPPQKRVFALVEHVLFLLRPGSYVAPVWFPARGARYLELVLVMAGAAASILMELVVGPARHQPFDDDGTVPSHHLHNFEHASISLALLVYAAAAIRLDRARAPCRDAVSALAAAAAFAQELLLFHLHSADHAGVEGQYHLLLQGVVAVTLATTVLGVAAPRSFAVSLVRSASLVLQGVWFVAMGVMLWTPALLPKGCFLSHEDGHDVARCSDEGGVLARAKALVNLQFSWYLSATVVLVVVLYLWMCRLYKEEPQYVPLVTANGHGNDTGDDDDVDEKDVEAAKGGSGRVGEPRPMEISL